MGADPRDDIESENTDLRSSEQREMTRKLEEPKMYAASELKPGLISLGP
jgi:hypothetical protein